MGLRYERTFASALRALFPDLLAGQWWEFEDAAGLGWAQCDLLVRSSPASPAPHECGTIIVECKVTASARGLAQLEQLYAPLVQHLTGVPPRCVLAAKNITPSVRPAMIVTSWSGVESVWPATPILHWREGPIPL
jgi:hypothetical protein